MCGEQLSLTDAESPNCPFKNFRDDWDGHCFSFEKEKNGYDVIGEENPKLAMWLASINGIEFVDISALEQSVPILPPFIPRINLGGKKIADPSIPYYTISLENACDSNNLLIPNIKDRLGIKKSSIILLCYGKDQIIEQIWESRKDFYRSIANSQIDFVTGINYSIWLDQPHAERLINLKRGLITFSEMQSWGLSAIPHIYWSGKKDLLRWAQWLETNKTIKTVAINLQTLKKPSEWQNVIKDLKFFKSILKDEPQFLITGPSTVDRISEIRHIFKQVTITNGKGSMLANMGIELQRDGELFKKSYSGDKLAVMKNNYKVYTQI